MTLNFKRQMMEAAFWTFLETFLVTIGPSLAVTQVGDWHALMGLAASAAMAAGAAAVSFIKSAVVQNIGTPNSIFVTAAACDDPTVTTAPAAATPTEVQ